MRAAGKVGYPRGSVCALVNYFLCPVTSLPTGHSQRTASTSGVRTKQGQGWSCNQKRSCGRGLLVCQARERQGRELSGRLSRGQSRNSGRMEHSAMTGSRRVLQRAVC